jgi:hypothetical protein
MLKVITFRIASSLFLLHPVNRTRKRTTRTRLNFLITIEFKAKIIKQKTIRIKDQQTEGSNFPLNLNDANILIFAGATKPGNSSSLQTGYNAE